jgi:diaminopimelate epimerase
MPIPFCKFHGFGNDYIVIERASIPAGQDLRQLARAICHRHTGAGADGIAVLTPGDDYNCEIINPDGSVAGFSGNGTRCAAAYLYHQGLWSGPQLRLTTPSGQKNFHLLDRNDRGYTFEAEIGKPRFAAADIPLRTSGSEGPVELTIDLNGLAWRGSALNVGNPVACVFVDNFNLDWRTAGSLIESHELFPQRTNVVFIRVVDRENLEVRIWERGAGETSASGTCASGAAVTSASLDKAGRSVNVHSPGGTSRVVWRDDDEIVLTGSAELAFCGEWPV